MNADIEKWIKHSNKKKAKLISYADDVYNIVYFYKGKARVGTVMDGMYCRYGIACRGAMYSTDPLSLWQSSAGSCTIADVKIMQEYLNETSNLPDFDFGVIRNLKH